ncbi:hypothetical protein IID27_03590 [Patescibacteria group bacterium]|nr:hypothetical protein [Patescibacteria group bacterium]
MKKDHEKLLTHLESPEPPAGLFDQIILAIKREQELRNTKKLVFGFLALLAISFTTAPFSWNFFLAQMVESGILQFISIAVNSLETFLALWPYSIIAVAESLPIMGIIMFVTNMILVVFTIRLFLYKKRLLVSYLLQRV